MTKAFHICCMVGSKKNHTFLYTFLHSSYATYSICGSSVGNVTRIRAGRSMFECRQGTRDFFLSHISRPALGPNLHLIPSLLGSFTEGRATGSVRLTTELNVVPMLRIRRPLFLYSPAFFNCVGSTNLNFV